VTKKKIHTAADWVVNAMPAQVAKPMGPRPSTRFGRSSKQRGKSCTPEWSKEGCKIFATVEGMLRAIIGYIHGTGRTLVPHEFDVKCVAYSGFRDPVNNRRWAVSSWSVKPVFSRPECDELPDESDLGFIHFAMCTMAGKRRLIQLAAGKELDGLLAMRKVMAE
jgi:hypothetical protein